jgi:hypothetical protein
MSINVRQRERLYGENESLRYSSQDILHHYGTRKLPCSQQPATGPLLEPVKSTPQLYSLVMLVVLLLLRLTTAYGNSDRAIQQWRNLPH